MGHWRYDTCGYWCRTDFSSDVGTRIYRFYSDRNRCRSHNHTDTFKVIVARLLALWRFNSRECLRDYLPLTAVPKRDPCELRSSIFGYINNDNRITVLDH